MSTRSSIGIRNGQDGNYHYNGIYCHWDGYPSYNGRILLEHYNTLERVEALIAQGDISYLGTKIPSAELAAEMWQEMNNGNFDCEKYNDWCMPYTGRGEPLVQRFCWTQEYTYVFDAESAVWYLCKLKNGKVEERLLSEVIAEIDQEDSPLF